MRSPLVLAGRLLSGVRRWTAGRAAAVRDRLRRPVMVELVAEEPAVLRRRRLYVSMRAGAPAVGWLRCPCGCGDVISLRLAGDRSPRWTIRALTGPATLEPSVWRKARCRSHFILRRGRILWC